MQASRARGASGAVRANLRAKALHDNEASLLCRITGLLYVSDRESGEARKRVLARLGLQ